MIKTKDWVDQFLDRYSSKGDWVIDATCGNGHDSLLIAQRILSENLGHLFVFDIQKQAIDQTKLRLKENLPLAYLDQISFICDSHANFFSYLKKETVNLIVYNLGYLPGSDKEKKTDKETTISSLIQGLELLKKGGHILLTCYPGHSEGKEEEVALIQFFKTLSKKEYAVENRYWINREKAPHLFVIHKY